MSRSRRRSRPKPQPDAAATPAPVTAPNPDDDGVKRPNPLMLMAMVVFGLWTQLWFGEVLLIPLAFWVTWAGKWERRHSVMALGALIWLGSTAAVLAAEPRRESLGLGSWTPPDWLVGAGTTTAWLMLILQGLGVGLLVWASDGMRAIFPRKPA